MSIAKVASRIERYAWLPAVAALAVICLIAAGVQFQHSANGATTSTETVTGVVGSSIALTPTCGNSANGIDDFSGLLQGAGAATVTGADCQMAVASNDSTGTKLNVLDGQASAATYPAFIQDSKEPTVPATSEFTDPSAASALAVGNFGLTLTGVTGTDAAAVFTTNASADPSAADWYPVADSAAKACNDSGPNNFTCSFRFGAFPAATQDSGTYHAQVEFSAVSGS